MIGCSCGIVYQLGAEKYNEITHDVTIKTFSGADHALFLSETGGMKELQRSFLKPSGQKVFAPGYLDLIAEWVQQRFGRERE